VLVRPSGNHVPEPDVEEIVGDLPTAEELAPMTPAEKKLLALGTRIFVRGN